MGLAIEVNFRCILGSARCMFRPLSENGDNDDVSV